MTEHPIGPIGWARRAQAEREKQPVRHTVDTITSDALDELYIRLWNATDAEKAWAAKAEQQQKRAKEAEAANARVRALHPEGPGDLCDTCHVPWPCPNICRLDGPPGCRNCGEHHTPIASLNGPKEPRP